MVPERWELGSDLHLLEAAAPAPARDEPWGGDARWYGAGRDALRAVLAHGRAAHGWRRLWIPAWFCQKVAGVLVATGLEVRAYPDLPGADRTDLGRVPAAAGDAVMTLDPYGLRGPARLAGALPAGVARLDDLSHDPWAPPPEAAPADYAFASLRKSLPVPDGAVLWSPRAHALPPQPAPTALREHASGLRLAAMVLKARYLAGEPVAKDAFRALAVRGEAAIDAGDVSGATAWSRALVDTFPVAAWREARRANHRALADALAAVPGVALLGPRAPSAAPFVAALAFDDPETRDRVRQALVEARIYPAVLWSLDAPATADVPADHVALSRRMLTVHCDMRYGPADMARVAGVLAAALAG